MKVYIVLNTYNYIDVGDSDLLVESVFLTKELAQKYIDEFEPQYRKPCLHVIEMNAIGD